MVAAFRRGLGEGGLVEGQNVVIEFRWARGEYTRLPALAAELVSRPVAVLVAAGGPLLPGGEGGDVDHTDRFQQQ